MELLIDIVQIVAGVLLVGSVFVAVAWRLKGDIPDDIRTYPLVYREPAGPRGVVEDDFTPWDLTRLHRRSALPLDPDSTPDRSEGAVRTTHSAMSNGEG